VLFAAGAVTALAFSGSVSFAMVLDVVTSDSGVVDASSLVDNSSVVVKGMVVEVVFSEADPVVVDIVVVDATSETAVVVAD